MGRKRKTFLTGTEFVVKDAEKSDRLVTLKIKANVSKQRKILKSGGRFSNRVVAKALCILRSRMHFNLRRILKERDISAR